MKLAWTWFIFPQRQTAASILVGIRDILCGRAEYKALREAGSQAVATLFYEAWITGNNCSQAVTWPSQHFLLHHRITFALRKFTRTKKEIPREALKVFLELEPLNSLGL